MSSNLNYIWKIKSLSKTNKNNVNDVVVQTYWTLTGVDENGYSGSFEGATPFELNNEATESFVPFSELNENIVVGWVQNVVVGSYWDHVNEIIQEKINQEKAPIVVLNENELPWSPESGSEVTPTP